MGLPRSFLPYGAVLGAAVGLVLVGRHWKRSVGRLSQSFLKEDGEYLEAKGVVNGGLTHVRFRLADIVTFEIGRKTPLVAGALPVVRAIDGAALVIRVRSGDGIVLQMAGVVFDTDQLACFRDKIISRRL